MRPDITLVHPLFIDKDPVEKKIMNPYFPLGLMYLGAVLRDAGYAAEMFDCAFRKEYDEFEDYMRRVRPKIVGITSLITIRRHALILSDIASKYGATVILGGPDPTGIPERYLYHQGKDGDYPIDLVVFDEAEITIVELMDHFHKRENHSQNIEDIAGLRLRGKNRQVIATAPREMIFNLDTIPFPARDMVDFQPYKEAWIEKHGYWSLSLINTRGCPYGCSWCQKAVFGRTYRSRTGENSAEEMKLIKDTYDPDMLRVVDDITGIRKEWVEEWREAIQSKKAAIPFECLTRVNLATEKMLTTLKEIECKKIYFGAESGSQKVLNAMDKGATVQQIYQAAEISKKIGIEIYFFMMVGYPGEEWEDLLLSVQLLRKTLPDSFSTTIAYPLPGTKFYTEVRDRMSFDSDWNLDWEYTAENKLLFNRGKYNTSFYRWVIRWFNAEWEDAWLKAGKSASVKKQISSKINLIIARVVVRFLTRLPYVGAIRFHPAEGR